MAVCIVQSSLLAWISLVHIDKVLVRLRFREVYVLNGSFSKTFLQIVIDLKEGSITEMSNPFKLMHGDNN